MSLVVLWLSELWSRTMLSALVSESHWWSSGEWAFSLEVVHHFFHIVHHGVDFFLVREFHLEMHRLTIDVGVKSEGFVRPHWVLHLLKVSATLGVVAVALVEQTVEFGEFVGDEVMQAYDNKSREIILLESCFGVLGLLLFDGFHGHFAHEENYTKGDESYEEEISHDVVHIKFDCEHVAWVSSVSL